MSPTLASAAGGLIDLSGAPASFTIHVGFPICVTISNLVMLGLLLAVFLLGMFIPLYPGRKARISVNQARRERQ